MHCVAQTGDATDELTFDVVSLSDCHLTLGTGPCPDTRTLLRTEFTIDMASYGKEPARVEVVAPADPTGRIKVRIASSDLPPVDSRGSRRADRGDSGTARQRGHVELFVYEDDLATAERLVEAIRERGRRCAGHDAFPGTPSN